MSDSIETAVLGEKINNLQKHVDTRFMDIREHMDSYVNGIREQQKAHVDMTVTSLNKLEGKLDGHIVKSETRMEDFKASVGEDLKELFADFNKRKGIFYVIALLWGLVGGYVAKGLGAIVALITRTT